MARIVVFVVFWACWALLVSLRAVLRILGPSSRHDPVDIRGKSGIQWSADRGRPQHGDKAPGAREPQEKVLPVYFVVDASASMTHAMSELNAGLASLLDEMGSDPIGAARMRLTVLSFSGDVRTHLDLQDLRELERMPTLIARSTTSYGAAFRDVRGRIDRDVDYLQVQGFQVHRPAVFFLSDGVPDPGDNWRAALATIRDPKWKRHPNIVAFGIGDADPSIINEVASEPQLGWMSTRWVMDPSQVLMQFFGFFTRSLVSSTRSPGELRIDVPAGFSMAVDLVT